MVRSELILTYVAQNHKSELKCFIIFIAQDTLCPQTLMQYISHVAVTCYNVFALSLINTLIKKHLYSEKKNL